MEYILSNHVKVKKPFLFLCGPYWDKSNPADRRNILREKIGTLYRENGQEAIPLIVDVLFDEKNIKYSEYSIQLMEEICAAISGETHIYLDTMSAATELGIFANSTYSNKMKVYIPYESDIYNKGNVGFFVRRAVLDNPNGSIEVINYRPRIKRASSSTTQFSEYYYFINDKLPKVIEDGLKKTISEKNLALDERLKFCRDEIVTDNHSIVGYSVSANELNFNVSIKLLFYVTSAVIQNEYPTIKKQDVKLLFDSINLAMVSEKIKEAIGNRYAFETGDNWKKYKIININTVCKYDFEQLIKHIAKLVYVYYYKSQYNSMQIVTVSDKVLLQDNIGKHPDSIFKLSEAELALCNAIANNPDTYFEKIVIKSRKKREIIKYRNNEAGEEARNLHEKIKEAIASKYKPDSHSYAYIKDRSIKDCVKVHLNSKSFIKLDIKKFFNSITQENLVKAIIKQLKIDGRYSIRVNNILASCFYEGMLPLGLCCSPILSDCYLHDFDADMSAYAVQNGYTYTRYADDIMLSSIGIIDDDAKRATLIYTSAILDALGLKINKEKTQAINFDKSHHFMRYVGINIVEDQIGKSNYLSVGNNYIHNLAKEYLEYEKLSASIEDLDEATKKTLFYKRAEIIGKIDFVRQIEEARGVKRLKTRLNKYYPQINLFDL